MRPRKLALALSALLVFAAGASRAQDEGEEEQPNPHAGGVPGMFQPPADSNEEDPHVPAGAISATIFDPDNHPMPGVMVTLGILHQSVAKGESRERKLATTDAQGAVSFSGLERGSGIAYRVMVSKDGGQFDATPFQLPLDKGMKVALHVYPVTHDIEQAIVVSQVATYLEMKDERAQIEEALTILNVGKVAWVPENLVLSLPRDYTGFSAQQGMTDQGVDEVDVGGVKGLRLHGTFPPGQHSIDFRWQRPYDGESSITIDEGMPPHLFGARVLASASGANHLVASGFPEAEPTDMQGQRVLVTAKQLRKGDPPLRTLHFELRDLPTPGPARMLATLLASLVAAGGLAFAVASSRDASKSRLSGGTDLRARLLDELGELERAHASGDVGPKTYERARRALIDALARSLASGDNERLGATTA